MGNDIQMNLDLGYTEKILDVCRIRGISLNRTAYILATAYWETGKTMEPVREAFYLGKKQEAYRKKLRYYPWYGRGFVQLTWEENYKKAGKRLGVDFTKDPDAVMDPDYSARILVIGMEEGWFTGKDLDDFIDDVDENDAEDRKEYEAGRKVVNGVDKKAEIADLALLYEKALREANYTPGITLPEPTAKPVSEAPKRSIWLSILRGILKFLFIRN
jgi:hypothetical protein